MENHKKRILPLFFVQNCSQFLLLEDSTGTVTYYGYFPSFSYRYRPHSRTAATPVSGVRGREFLLFSRLKLPSLGLTCGFAHLRGPRLGPFLHFLGSYVLDVLRQSPLMAKRVA